MGEQSADASKQVQVMEGAQQTSDHKMKELIHNGVLIPDAYVPQGFAIKFRGTPLKLDPLQEEMAVKFAQKFGTPYTEDTTFCSNFMKDFATALGIKEKTTVADFDWTPITRWIEAERARKANMSKEERKQLAAARKKLREERKEHYGWATVDGTKMEIGNYAVEPPSIFMGRGCVSGDTIAKTPAGPKYVSELVRGDRIASHIGSGHMPYGQVDGASFQGVRDIFELRTRTHMIRATTNHPFLKLKVWKLPRRARNGQFTDERYRPELRWEKLANIRTGDHLVVVKKYAEEGT
ncbi:MAG TPA: hypothetical protein VEI80_06755, partial [Candidatus Acidoferrales bacterium]|nr:hypothetical protein [Candidatus Acidoferrales bacterium]